jgi:hypothetical protein
MSAASLHDDELEAVLAGAVDLDLHVALADDLALEGGGKRHGDGQLLGLDLDAAQLEGLFDGLAVVAHGLERARDLVLAEVDVDHDREAQRDGAGARGDDDVVDGAEGVDERGYARLGVGQQPRQIARLHVAEDERRADGDGDDVDDCGHVMAQGDDAELEAHLDAGVGALLDDVAHEEGHDALGLVVLDDFGGVGAVFSLAEHDGHAGDVARDEGHAERADDGIGHEADAGDARLLVGFLLLDILEALEDLRADGGGEAGVERLAQVLLIRDEALEHADARGQIAQLLNLDARGRVDGREIIGRVGEGDFLLRAVSGNRVVDRALCQTGNGMGPRHR